MIFTNFGKKPLCNGKIDHAPKIGNFVFPLCWRCSSISVTMLILRIMNVRVLANKANILSMIILVIPCLIDGLIQECFKVESTTFKRVTTGFLAGIGLYMFIKILAYYLYI